MHISQAQQTESITHADQQIYVTSLQTKPPNNLRVKQLPSSVPESTSPDGTRVGVTESHKILSQDNTDKFGNYLFTSKRGDKAPRNKRKVDEKYKRFSMNNLEEFKNSLVDLFEFSLTKERPKTKISYHDKHRNTNASLFPKSNDSKMLLESMYFWTFLHISDNAGICRIC